MHCGCSSQQVVAHLFPHAANFVEGQVRVALLLGHARLELRAPCRQTRSAQNFAALLLFLWVLLGRPPRFVGSPYVTGVAERRLHYQRAAVALGHRSHFPRALALSDHEWHARGRLLAPGPRLRDLIPGPLWPPDRAQPEDLRQLDGLLLRLDLDQRNAPAPAPLVPPHHAARHRAAQRRDKPPNVFLPEPRGQPLEEEVAHGARMFEA